MKKKMEKMLTRVVVIMSVMAMCLEVLIVYADSRKPTQYVEAVVEQKPKSFIINTMQDSIEVKQESEIEKAFRELEELNWDIQEPLKPLNITKVIKDLGWQPNYEMQCKIYDYAKRYKNNYFLMLTIYLLEGSHNNPRAIHHNKNGTTDRGYYQLNDCCAHLLEQLGYEKDVELFFDEEINLRSSNLKVRSDKRYYKNVNNLFTQLFNYTGGNTTLTDFLTNGLDENNELMVRSYNYSIKGLQYMILLYQQYHGIIE